MQPITNGAIIISLEVVTQLCLQTTPYDDSSYLHDVPHVGPLSPIFYPSPTRRRGGAGRCGAAADAMLWAGGIWTTQEKVTITAGK